MSRLFLSRNIENATAAPSTFPTEGVEAAQRRGSFQEYVRERQVPECPLN
jgi:hypothetical protein